jgi:hypothetical protein
MKRRTSEHSRSAAEQREDVLAEFLSRSTEDLADYVQSEDDDLAYDVDVLDHRQLAEAALVLLGQAGDIRPSVVTGIDAVPPASALEESLLWRRALELLVEFNECGLEDEPWNELCAVLDRLGYSVAEVDEP